jgi:hypothetical protein
MKSRISLSSSGSDSTRASGASICGWEGVSERANMESLKSSELARILA